MSEFWMYLIAAAVVAVVAVVIHRPKLPSRKRSCASKSKHHRYHDWSEWIMTQEVKIYRDLNPDTGFRGCRLHFARRCGKCGLPDFKVERDFEGDY